MKRICSLILAVVIAIASSVFVYADEDIALVCADTTGDGIISADDALEVLKYAARLSEGFSTDAVVDENYLIGDVNGDFLINAEDALDILKYAAKLIDSFDIYYYKASKSADVMYAGLLQNIESDVTLGEYKGFEVEIEKVVITDEDVQEYIDFDLEYYGTYEEIREGVVAVGDSINIDYVGLLEGEAIDGGSEEGVELTIGSGVFVEGFEDALIGKSIGETVEFSVTFPEDYYEDLAGKQAEFTVTINYKYGELTPAELTDELVIEMAYGDDVTTVEEYKQYVRDMLEEEEIEMQKSEAFSEIIDKIMASSKVNNYSDPYLNADALFEEELSYMEELAKSYGYSYEEFISLYAGMTVEEYEAILMEDIIYYVNQMMIYRAIAKAEGITVSQEEYEEDLQWYVYDYESYGCASMEEFEEEYGLEVYEYLIYDKVDAFLQDSMIVNIK